MPADAIYDYQTPIEEAIASVMVANEVTCYTPLGEQIIVDGLKSSPDALQQFEKKRPRIEIVLTGVSGIGRLWPYGSKKGASGFNREQAYSGQLTVRVITEANIVTQRAYLSLVQNLMDTIGAAANVATKADGSLIMPYHCIGGIRKTGDTPNYAPQDGLIETMLTYNLDFSVVDTAWALLDT